MAKEEQEVSTAEIAQALKQGYRQFRVYEKGLELARTVLELEGRVGQLTAAKNTAEEEARAAGLNLQDMQKHVTEMEGKRDGLLSAFKEDTRLLLAEREQRLASLDVEIRALQEKLRGLQEGLQVGLRVVEDDIAQKRATGEEQIRRDIAILEEQKTSLESRVSALRAEEEAFNQRVADIRKR